MGYATNDDLKNRLGEQRYAAIYQADEGNAESDRMESEAELNGYLAKRYVVPVAAAEAEVLLRGWTLDLTEERAYNRSGGSAIPEKIRTRAASVRQCLCDVAKGIMVLPAEAEENPRSPGGSAFVTGNDPEFTREQMAGY